MENNKLKLNFFLAYYQSSKINKFLILVIKIIIIQTYSFIVKISDLLLGKQWQEKIPKLHNFFIKIISFNLNVLLGLINCGKLIPPPELTKIFGSGSFKDIGEEFLRHFIKLGGLKPNERILEVGSGIGQKVIPLTKYLTTGNFEGFDIVTEGIKWCKENITNKFPNFHFQLADVYNMLYHPEGKYEASEYKFPFEDESFDFVYLTSVFTHMRPKELENYFSEIVRVLKRKERCLITYFILNDESLTLINNKSSSLDFKYEFGVYRTVNKEVHESAIAYDIKFIREIYKKYGLTILEPIYFGYWCDREKVLSYQDIIIAVKE